MNALILAYGRSFLAGTRDDLSITSLMASAYARRNFFSPVLSATLFFSQDRICAIQALSLRRFTARQVIEAAKSTEDVLTNFLTKVKPILCSESGGRGRARQFCLIDSYQFALWCTLTRITRNANWSARALDYVLFSEVTYYDLETLQLSPQGDNFKRFQTTRTKRQRKAHIEFLRAQFCADITKTPALYWTRRWDSLTQSWIIFAKHLDIEDGQFKLTAVSPDDSYRPVMNSFGDTGVFLNATSFLLSVDRRLAKLAGLNEAGSNG